jgi:hypothetical protein
MICFILCFFISFQLVLDLFIIFFKNFSFYSLPLSLSFKALAGLNPAPTLAAISISSPVLGLRPFLALRDLGSNVPNPGSTTFLPSTRVCYYL